MTDEELPPPWEERPFDHISLTEEQAHLINCAFNRPRDLHRLVSDALFFSMVLEGRSPRIDESTRVAIRHHVDLTRLLLAALPARDQSDLNLKLAALDPPDPLVAEHVNLRAMLEAGARADIQRLKPPNPPRWILEWAITLRVRGGARRLSCLVVRRPCGRALPPSLPVDHTPVRH